MAPDSLALQRPQGRIGETKWAVRVQLAAAWS